MGIFLEIIGIAFLLLLLGIPILATVLEELGSDEGVGIDAPPPEKVSKNDQ